MGGESKPALPLATALPPLPPAEEDVWCEWAFISSIIES
jgi:hypothetical protein